MSGIKFRFLVLMAFTLAVTSGCCGPLKKQRIDVPMDDRGRRMICLYNLEMLLDAKQEWARDTGAKAGQMCPKPEVLAHRYFRMYKYGRRSACDDDTQSRQVFTAKCPCGGNYIIGSIGQRPKCSVHGDLLWAYDTKIAVPHSH
ncbi:MAG: hypothetical protein PHX74_10815 [Candidatus Sumerlaeales bacterium]|nr:hypothetical protein [Candidatus Sumerlaeales bacterium]